MISNTRSIVIMADSTILSKEFILTVKHHSGSKSVCVCVCVCVMKNKILRSARV